MVCVGSVLPALFMEPHHHQVVRAARFSESQLYGFLVDGAASIVCFGYELQERFCERSVPVQQCVLPVMAELDRSQLDEIINRSCRLQAFVDAVDELCIWHCIKLSSVDHQLCADNWNHLAVDGGFERPVPVNILGDCVLFPCLLHRKLRRPVEALTFLFLSRFPLKQLGRVVGHDDYGCSR